VYFWQAIMKWNFLSKWSIAHILYYSPELNRYLEGYRTCYMCNQGIFVILCAFVVVFCDVFTTDNRFVKNWKRLSYYYMKGNHINVDISCMIIRDCLRWSLIHKGCKCYLFDIQIAQYLFIGKNIFYVYNTFDIRGVGQYVMKYEVYFPI
jgi:hypothetical protein